MVRNLISHFFRDPCSIASESLELEDSEPMEVRLVELLELKETREKVFNSLHNRQQIIKRWFNKKSSDLGFKCEDLVLKYNEQAAKLGQHMKFDNLWEGPFCIIECK